MHFLEDLVQDGIRWQIDADWRESLLGQGTFAPQQWVDAGAAEVVKDGPARTVYRVSRAGRSFYLKHFRIASAGARVRAWWSSKAQQEARYLRRLAELGIATLKLVAVGRVATGETYLVTAAIDQAESLTQYLATSGSQLRPTQRRQLASALAELVAQMHACGVQQRDFHPGNILIRTTDSGLQLFLIDLHDLTLGKPLTGQRAMRNLVQLNLYFSQHVARTDRRRFFHEYCRRRPELGWDLRAAAKRLERTTERWCHEFWRKRDRRAETDNKYFYHLNAGSAWGFAVRELEATLLQHWLTDLEGWLQQAGAQLVKRSRRSTVWRVALPGERSTVIAYVKEYAGGRGLQPYSPLIRPPRALRAWRLLNQLCVRGFPTARPLAVIECARWGRERSGYLITQQIEQSQTLHQWLHQELSQCDPSVAAHRRRRVAEQLARWIRRLHDLGFSHRDLKTPNVLVADDDELFLIDVDGFQFRRRVRRARRCRDLARLSAAVAAAPGITHGLRLRFLLTYLGREGRRHRAWKQTWRFIAHATRQKLARNRRLGRPIT